MLVSLLNCTGAISSIATELSKCLDTVCLRPTISPGLVPDKFARRRVEDVPDAQTDGSGQAKRGNGTAHLFQNMSPIPRSQSRTNGRNRGFKCPRSVVAFLWMRDRSSRCRRCRVDVRSAPRLAGSWVACYGGLRVGVGMGEGSGGEDSEQRDRRTRALWSVDLGRLT